MQQIHPWLIGFGVSQLEQRWNSKSSGISRISTLRKYAQGQNIIYKHTTCVSFKQTVIQKQAPSQIDAPEYTQTLMSGV